MGPVASANRRQLIERGAFVALVGIAVLGVVGAALVALYINRIADSAAALKHSEPLPDYVGRPSSATAPDGTSAMNVLVAVTDNGGLQAVVVANLSASRRNLTLIAVPAALRLAAGEEHTLASSFAADPMLTARAVERLTGSRVDHLIQVDLAGFADVVDAVGGVQLDGQELDGAAAVAAVRDSDQPSTAAAALLRATLVSAEPSLGMPALAVPVDATRPASHCTRIDAGLTSEVIAQTLMASSVRASEIRIWPLTTVVDGDAVVPEVGALGILTAALAEPNLTATAAYGAAAFLPR